jgi:hypothetical protein
LLILGGHFRVCSSCSPFKPITSFQNISKY